MEIKAMLKDAEMCVMKAEQAGVTERRQSYAMIAIAHALIAIAEQMKQNAELAAQARADAERTAQVEERLALRRAKERIP